MAVNTSELKAKFSIEDKMSKEFKKIKSELKEVEKVTKDVDKVFKNEKKFKADTTKAKKDISDVKKVSKDAEKVLKSKKDFKVEDKASGILGKIKNKFKDLKLNSKIPVEIKDLASAGVSKVKSVLEKLGPLGKIPLKILGKHPALAVVGAVAIGIGKLAHSAYNEVKLRIQDMTAATLNKVKETLNSMKDFTINMSIKGYDQFSDFKARSSFIPKGMNFQKYNSEINKLAMSTRQPVADMQNNVNKLMQMSGELFNGDASKAIAFQSTLSKAFRVGGSAPEEQMAAMYQLNQALASGTLQGDELRSIRENAPQLAKIIQDEVGGSIKEAGAQGLLTSQVVYDAIMKHSKEINEQFKKIPLNFNDIAVMSRSALEIGFFQPMFMRMNEFMNLQHIKDSLVDFFNGLQEMGAKLWEIFDMTNFGGIDLGILWESLAPIRDLFTDVYESIINKSPEAQEAVMALGDIVNGAFEGMGEVFLLFKDIAVDVFTFLKENPNIVKEIITTLAKVWEMKWEAMKLKMEVIKIILPAIQSISSAISGIIGTLKDLIKWWNDAWENMRKKALSNPVGLQGKLAESGAGRAMGQSRVPYDNFLVNAHQGERILTKREANAYEKDKGSSGVTINMYGTVIREKADIDLLADRFVKKWKIAKVGGM